MHWWSHIQVMDWKYIGTTKSNQLAVLQKVGGFNLAFEAVGSFLFLAAILTTILFPQIAEPLCDKAHGFLKLLLIPDIIISYYGVFAVCFSFGFTQALFEPHLRQFNLSPSSLGIHFIIMGAAYSLTAVVWGYVAGKGVNPKILCGNAAFLKILAFILMGPAPFLPWKTQTWMVILALVLPGIGLGGLYVATFVDSGSAAIKNGFPDNADTYGLVAGVWMSGSTLDIFAGPSLCGVLIDSVGFRNTSQLVAGLHFIVVVQNFGYFAYERRITTYDQLPET